MRKLIALLPLCLLNLSACETGDQSAGAETMISHFAGTCRASVGAWTTAALQQTQSLISTLEVLKAKQDANCAGLTAALEKTQQLHHQLQRMALDPAVATYRIAEERKLELLLAMGRANGAQTPDPDLIEKLRLELYETELDIVKTRAEASVAPQEQRRADIINGVSQLNQYVASLLSQGNFSACLASAPQMPLGIASSLLTIGGNFATPVVGAAMSTLGNLMATTVNYLRNLPIDRMQLDLQNTQMQSALTCSLESMSDLYCDAQTSYHFIELALLSYEESSQPNDVWRGMDLLGRKLPVLNRWLQKVSSGVDPSDRHSATRLNEIWRKQTKLKEITNLVQGEINETRRLLSGVGSPSERIKRENSCFKKVINHVYAHSRMMGSEDVSPVEDFVSRSLAICQLSGNPACVPPGPLEDPDATIDKYGMAGGLGAFEERADNLLDEVSRLISKELLDTINQDPAALIADATQNSLDGPSPQQVMVALSDFSARFAERMRRSRHLQAGSDRAIAVAEETARILEELSGQIVGQAPPPEVIEAVFAKLKLLDGLQFLNQRVSQMVRWDLESRIRAGELPPKVSDDMIAAGISVVDQLERSGIYVERDADALVGDIRNAQLTSRENLKATTQFFGPTLGKLMAQIRKSAIDAGETNVTDPGYRRLAQLCILTLTTAPKWPEGVDIELCRGTKLVSMYRNSGVELDFDRLKNRVHGGNVKFQDRVCVYSNFLRAARLFRTGNDGRGRRTFSADLSEGAPVITVTPRQLDDFIFSPARATGPRH